MKDEDIRCWEEPCPEEADTYDFGGLHVCMQVLVHMCVHTCEGQRTNLGIIPKDLAI